LPQAREDEDELDLPLRGKEAYQQRKQPQLEED
jgi:hypothetical protein